MNAKEATSGVTPASQPWLSKTTWRRFFPAEFYQRHRNKSAAVAADAREIITRERLDVIVKYLFFRSLAGELDRAQWEPIYRRHILDRTGGAEPPDLFRNEDSPKRSVDDYVRGCEALLQSLITQGFDPAQPIPVYPNNRLLNGAHRLACGLATGLPVVVQRIAGDGGTWDFQWFVDRQYSQNTLADILYHYACLSQRALGIVVLWGPVMQAWPAITDQLEQQFDVVGWLDHSFDEQPTAFESTVRDMYSLEWGELSQPNIRRKVVLLNQSRRVFRVVLVEDRHGDRSGFLETLRRGRDEIRRNCDHLVPNDAFCTCHASTSNDESRYLVELLLGESSRTHRMLRLGGEPRSEFGQWLFQLADELSRHGLSRHDVCIVGSSPLEVLGIRNSTDIDITIASRFRQRFGAGVTHLCEWLDIVTETYARAHDRAPITDDQLISDARHHFWYRGFKFASPQIVLARKALQARPKDLADVEASQRYFSQQDAAAPRHSTEQHRQANLIAFLVDRERELATGRL